MLMPMSATIRAPRPQPYDAAMMRERRAARETYVCASDDARWRYSEREMLRARQRKSDLFAREARDAREYAQDREISTTGERDGAATESARAR